MEKSAIKALLGTENPTILEIGAHHGEDTNDFLNTFKQGKFYAFEPDPRCVKQFNKNVNDERCQFFPIAISDKNTKERFYQSGGWPPNMPGKGDWDYSGSLKTPTGHFTIHPWCTFNKITTVNTKTLDSWTTEHLQNKTIDFIWCDVQGAEDMVIKGAGITLKYQTKYLYTEFENAEQYEGQLTLDGILKKLPSFEPLQQYDNNILLRNRGFFSHTV